MDDRVLALCELSNDLIYGKIPKDKLSYYVSNSLLAGKDAARQFQGCDIFELYRKNEIQINYLEKSSEQFGVMLRGNIVLSGKGCSVELYRESIRQLAAHSKTEDGAALNYDSALRIHLAHEFYHFLEYREGSTIATRLEPVITLNLKFCARRAHVRRCEEVAAHAFAKELLALPVLPNYYDYLYLIDCGKLTRFQFETMLETKRQLLAPFCS